MDKTELVNRITEIGSCEDDVKRRELLTALSEECEKDYETLSELSETNKALTSDNEALRSANMKLFLRVGESKTKDEKFKDETGINDKPKERKSLLEIFNS